MTSIFLAAVATGFLLLPLVVLCLRAAGPKWFTGPVALCVVALLGWFLVNAGLHLYYQHLSDQMRAYGNNPPQQLVDELTSDGAKLVFTLLFGGFYALIYYAPFALIYEMARGVKRFYSKRRALTL